MWSGFGGRFVNYFGVNYYGSMGPQCRSGGQRDPDGQPWRTNQGRLARGDGAPARAHPDHRCRARPGTGTIADQSRENTNTAGYAELQSQFAERFFLVANVRQDENGRFGGATTYRVAPAILIPTTETKLKASYGTGFKAPSLDELFFNSISPFFTFLANPNLRPERSRGWDAGFEQPVFDNRLRFGATYFENDIIDLITFQSLSFTARHVDQHRRAKTSGVETFLCVQPVKTFRIRGDYTYTKAIDAITGLELLRRPKNKASVTVRLVADRAADGVGHGSACRRMGRRRPCRAVR